MERELRARPRRWLVTGAAGFSGSHLVEHLLALGQDVHGLDDFSTGRRSNLAHLARTLAASCWRRFVLFEGDVRDAECVRAASAGVQFVLHQAGLGSVPRSLLEPARAVDVNARGTWVVLEGARAAGARRLVFASSSSVYGDSGETPQREERIGRALSPYAVAKQVAELATAGVSRSTGFPSVALRYFNVFGPRQDPDGPYAAVIPRWSAALLQGRRACLEGDGAQTRDFTPVSAVVEANLLAATTELAEPAAVFNVGTGRETRLDELFLTLRRVCAERRPGCAAQAAERVPARPGDRCTSRADLTRIRLQLGYEPPLTLEPGLRATVGELVDSALRAS